MACYIELQHSQLNTKTFKDTNLYQIWSLIIYCLLFIYEGMEWCDLQQYTCTKLVSSTRLRGMCTNSVGLPRRQLLSSRAFSFHFLDFVFTDFIGSGETGLGACSHGSRVRPQPLHSLGLGCLCSWIIVIAYVSRFVTCPGFCPSRTSYVL